MNTNKEKKQHVVPEKIHSHLISHFSQRGFSFEPGSPAPPEILN